MRGYASAVAIRFRAPFPDPPYEPLREGATIHALIAVQTTRRTLYKPVRDDWISEVREQNF